MTGFILTVIRIVVIVINIVFVYLEKVSEKLKAFSIRASSLIALCSVFWFIWGLWVGLRHATVECSNNLIVSAGNFIGWIYLMPLIVLGLAISVPILLTCFFLCCKGDVVAAFWMPAIGCLLL